MRPILKIQTTVLREIVNYMAGKGFIQLMPVIVSKITDPLGPDPGSSVVAVPKIEYYGTTLCLTQSMILHKQLAVSSGLKKIFIMSPNIRLEDKRRSSSGRHLFEFTQMDFEIADGRMEDVFRTVEGLLVHVLKAVIRENKDDLESLGRKLKIPETPFKVYTSHDLEAKYGANWEFNASKDSEDPFWVVCFKREFYDREDPENTGHYRNYDLIYPEGFGEALSGGEREWEYDRIIRRITRDGLNPNLYAPYLDAAKRGVLVPSAGAGLGIERFLRFLTGKSHISEVQLFPRVPGWNVIF